jgi:heme/copper-type cytochrome/quinol oxidase subunit 4
MNKRLKKVIYVFVVCIVLMLPAVVFAKRTRFYVPPPFATRLFCSFVTILPCMVVLSLAAYFAMRVFDKERARNKKLIFVCIVAVLIIAGSILSAMDALNDELWNPALSGSFAGTLIFPIAILLLNKKIGFIKRLIIAVLLVIPFHLLSLFVFEGWQELGRHLGLPTTW